MNRSLLLVCFALLFQLSKIQAADIEQDTILLQSIKAQLFSNETVINSFCYGKKLTIDKGTKEDCLLINRYLESIFMNLVVKNQRIGIRRSVYCVKDGILEVGDDSLNSSKSIQKLDYYIIAFKKKNTFISQYISELKSKLYEVIIPAAKMPSICYLFTKDDTLIILSHKMKITLSDSTAENEKEMDMGKIIEFIRK